MESRVEASQMLMVDSRLDVDRLIQAVATDSNAIVESESGRNSFLFARELRWSLSGPQLPRVGSAGFQAFWMDIRCAVPHKPPVRRLNLVTLQIPECDSAVGIDMTPFSRTLNVPINVERVMDILAFSDESAVLAVLTRPCMTGCCPRSTRFLHF